MTREELKAALRAAADDYKRATDELVAEYATGLGSHDRTRGDYATCPTCGAVLVARQFEAETVMQRHHQGHLDRAW